MFANDKIQCKLLINTPYENQMKKSKNPQLEQLKQEMEANPYYSIVDFGDLYFGVSDMDYYSSLKVYA